MVVKKSSQLKRIGVAVLLIAAIIAVVAGAALIVGHTRSVRSDQNSTQNSSEPHVLHVLTYSAFVSAWGPGADIAKAFEAKELEAARPGQPNVWKVEYVDAGDEGLLLRKLELFPADVVLGIDNLDLPKAKAARTWREWRSIDWAPMGFVYRKSEISDPPKSLQDLLNARFRNSIALEDPRTSAPGLHFLDWIISALGEEPAFEFLRQIKPNVFIVAPGWSGAYGAFTKRQAKLAFTYLTSPIYHQREEKSSDVTAAAFSAQPLAEESAAIPESCSSAESCAAAHRFLDVLISEKVQRLLMTKNYMLSRRDSALVKVEGTDSYDRVARLPLLQFSKLDSGSEREALLRRWQQAGF